jgi:hypothetical protein
MNWAIVRDFANFLFASYPRSLIELRAFRAWDNFRRNMIVPRDPGYTMGGLFDDRDEFLAECDKCRGVSVYVSPNPIRRDARPGRRNKLVRLAKGEGVCLHDLEFLRWLHIDIDPVCEEGRRGINATAEEHQACLDLMNVILESDPLIDRASMFGSSGNGAYLLVRVDDLPITSQTQDLVAAFIRTLIAKYHGVGGLAGEGLDSRAKIDPGSRDITKKIGVPGTWKCKGPDTSERPRRLVEVHRLGETVMPLDLAAWLA